MPPMPSRSTHSSSRSISGESVATYSPPVHGKTSCPAFSRTDNDASVRSTHARASASSSAARPAGIAGTADEGKADGTGSAAGRGWVAGAHEAASAMSGTSAAAERRAGRVDGMPASYAAAARRGNGRG